MKTLNLEAKDINIIIDALQYATEQTRTSNGDIQAFCRDSEWTFTPDENLAMADESERVANTLLNLFEDGGFDVIITEDEVTSSIRAKSEEDCKEVVYKKARFYINDDDTTYSGYTFGYLWNGWECPYFDYDESVKLMNDYKENFNAYFDATSDTFVFEQDDGFNQTYEVKGEDITYEGQTIHVYAIGNCCWIWDKKEESRKGKDYLAIDREHFIYWITSDLDDETDGCSVACCNSQELEDELAEIDTDGMTIVEMDLTAEVG